MKDKNKTLELMFDKMQEFLRQKTPCIRSSFDEAMQCIETVDCGKKDIETFVHQILPGIGVPDKNTTMRASAFISALIQGKVKDNGVISLNLRNMGLPMDYFGAMLKGANLLVYGAVGDNAFFADDSCNGRVFGEAGVYFADLASNSLFLAKKVGKGALLEANACNLHCLEAGDLLGKMSKGSTAIVLGQNVGNYAGLCSQDFTLKTAKGTKIGPYKGYNASGFLHQTLNI